MTEKYSNYSSRSRTSPIILKLIVWVITGIIVSIIMTNIKPYELIAAGYLSGVEYPDITNFLTDLWAVGLVFALLFKFANFGLGTLLWAFIQILEIIPTELLGHEKFLDRSIQKGSANKYTSSEEDSWEINIAKKLRNSLSTEVLRFLILLGVCIYVVDFFACLTVFPPVQGGGDVWKLLEVIQYQQTSKIDWGNILRAITTVGAVQFLLKLRRTISEIASNLKD